jgi:hypothetical protein
MPEGDTGRCQEKNAVFINFSKKSPQFGVFGDGQKGGGSAIIKIPWLSILWKAKIFRRKHMVFAG